MSNDWKIYTKTGDKGETSLIGGTRVPKFHSRIEAYGTLDELNSFIGLLRDQMDPGEDSSLLLEIQDRIFTAESLLAADTSVQITRQLPAISEEDVKILEKAIDQMNTVLPELKSFILPGGHPLVSLCHVCRTVCRRAERLTIKLSTELEVDTIIIQYLNRLSDYLFVLARKISFDRNIPDLQWKPRIK